MYNRRDFLKHSAMVGAAAAAAVTPFSVSAAEAKKKKPVMPIEPVKTYTVSMRSVMNVPKMPPRKITIPDTSGFKVLKGDFHIHTLFSDGQVMPGDRVKEAVQNGLDVISLTDHIEVRPFFSNGGRWKMDSEIGRDYNIAYNTAKADAEQKELLLIPGTEITKHQIPPGHFNALFTQDVNPIAAAVDDWREMLKIAADQGCFLIWDHPGWESQIGKGAPLQFFKEHQEAWEKGWMHGIEIFNGTEHYPIVSDWANEKDLALFANSDIHPSEVERYGLQNPMRPITLVLAKERTIESIREAMFAKRTIGWAAGKLWGRDPWLPELFKASVEIKRINLGTLELINRSSLPITITMGGISFDLQKDVKRQAYHAEDTNVITVTNWMVGMNKALEIPFEGLF